MCHVKVCCGVCSVLWRVGEKGFGEQVLVELCATEHKSGALSAEALNKPVQLQSSAR